MKLLALVIGALVIVHSEAQFMDGFFQQMNMMMGNMMENNQRMFAETMRQAQSAGAQTQNVPPGTRRTFNDGNNRGFAYRSPDGSFSSFSFSSGGPGFHGGVFHAGPDGYFERRW